MEERNENLEEDVSDVISEESSPFENVSDEDNAPLDKNVKLLSPAQMVMRRFFRSKLSVVGLIMIVSLFLFSFVGPLVYTRWGEIELDESGTVSYTPNEVTYVDENGVTHVIQQTTERLEKDNYLAPPSKDHLLGTDEQGYDVFTRLMYGGRISLSVSFIAVIVITVLGVVLGGISGYFGGFIDNVIQRIIEVLSAIPSIPLWLALSAAIPPDISVSAMYLYITIILSFIGWTGLARVVRGKFISLRNEDFVMAARLAGVSDFKIIIKHMVPGFLSYLIVNLTLGIPGSILGETSMSYLGLGMKAPATSWGVLLQETQDLVSVAQCPWKMIPLIFVIITVLAFNFLGDGMRDAADPYK